MASHRDQYRAVIGKKRWMQSENAYSVPDNAGSKVAILTPFINELIQNDGDNYEHFVAQAAAYQTHFKEQDRVPVSIMGATIEDFRKVLADVTIPSVVVAGWGTLSSVSAPFSRDRRVDARYGHLDWQQLADMATHLKLGKFIMLQCGGHNKKFNPPLPLGVVSSHANIHGYTGQIHYAADTAGAVLPPPSITTSETLTYDEINEQFPMQRNRTLPVPDVLYSTMQGVYNAHINPNMPDIPDAEPMQRPNLGQYRQYWQLGAA